MCFPPHETEKKILQLLEHWESLPLYNRIPKRVKNVSAINFVVDSVFEC